MDCLTGMMDGLFDKDDGLFDRDAGFSVLRGCLLECLTGMLD